MKTLLTIFALATLVTINPVHAAGDADAGKTKAATCSGCHGPDGNSPVPTFPKIAGQHAEYIAKQLHDYKSGARENATMSPMAMPLSDQDILDLSAYFASQTVRVGKADAEKVTLGQAIYMYGNSESGVSACAACHGPAGQGNPMANFPGVGGQHAAYTTEQLQHFRSKARANDAGSMMRGVAAKMTDAEIAAVAQYIQGLN